MDGIQSTKKIKEFVNKNKIKNNYIIIITTQSSEDDKRNYQ